MGTVILADVTELTTVKISELDEATAIDTDDVVPMVKAPDTMKIKRDNLAKDLPIDGGTF